MIRQYLYIIFAGIVFAACTGSEGHQAEIIRNPIVTENGNRIEFHDTKAASFFKTERLNTDPMQAPFTAPGKIAASVLPSGSGAAQNIILFDNPDLASNYTQLIQHQINVRQIKEINIKQREIELERVIDLQKHGAATGQELLDAQTALSIEKTSLANERTGLIEHESILMSGGFDPEMLHSAKPGTVYVVSNIAENLISKIEEGGTAILRFTAYPEEEFSGTIEAVGDVVDNVSRMVKVRILVQNTSSKLKAGMFAMVSFNLEKGDFSSIDKHALVTVQGRNYVFVKTGETTFERREINIGQEIGDKVIIFNTLNDTDEIAVNGVLQLKGLSFGY